MTLSDTLDGPLQAGGWRPLGETTGWDREADLDPSGLPVYLALLPLGDGPDAPLVFLASLPVLVARDHREAAAAVVAEHAAVRVPVGTVVLEDGTIRYRLAHDPRLGRHSPRRALELATVGLDWAETVLPDLVRALGRHGVVFEDVTAGPLSYD